MNKPFSKTAFWDVDYESLDLDKDLNFIVRRIADYGLLIDIIWMLDNIDHQTIRETLTEARYLNKKTVSFFAHHLKIKPSDFRCLRNQSLNDRSENRNIPEF